MSGVNRVTASLGQANGPDVELVVDGTELYATYETKDGFPAIYDDGAGLYCYARLVGGEFQSTGVPVTSPAPESVERHVQESLEVRQRKIAQREAQMARRSHLTKNRSDEK